MIASLCAFLQHIITFSCFLYRCFRVENGVISEQQMRYSWTMARNSGTLQGVISNTVRKTFNALEEEEGWERISLSKPSRECDVACLIPINLNRVGDKSNTFHDVVNHSTMKTKHKEHMIQIWPLHTIECLAYILKPNTRYVLNKVQIIYLTILAYHSL